MTYLLPSHFHCFKRFSHSVRCTVCGIRPPAAPAPPAFNLRCEWCKQLFPWQLPVAQRQWPQIRRTCGAYCRAALQRWEEDRMTKKKKVNKPTAQPPKSPPSARPKPVHDSNTEPDWTGKCEVCGGSPIVPATGMCGPCTFGEADTIGGNW
jgi:hypothetical protein